jgi:hypothetical protein
MLMYDYRSSFRSSPEISAGRFVRRNISASDKHRMEEKVAGVGKLGRPLRRAPVIQKQTNRGYLSESGSERFLGVFLFK